VGPGCGARCGQKPVSVTDVCVVAVSCARVSGAWVTAVAGQGPDFVMCVTDPVSEQLAELQLTLGEGPCHDVLASAAPVLAGGLADDHARQWPAFAPEAGQFGARAVFAFPLAVGAILAGTMGLYRDSPGPLTRAQLGDTLLLADSTTALLIDSTGHDSEGSGTGRAGPGPGGAPRRGRPGHRHAHPAARRHHHRAFARLRTYAYARDRRLADVAANIVARRLRLHPDADPDPDPAPGTRS